MVLNCTERLATNIFMYLKVLQTSRIHVMLFVSPIEHCMSLAKQLINYVHTFISMHKVFNMQICPAIFTLFKILHKCTLV